MKTPYTPTPLHPSPYRDKEVVEKSSAQNLSHERPVKKN